jgi:hypothetical protein
MKDWEGAALWPVQYAVEVFLHAHDAEHSIIDVTKTAMQRLEMRGKVCNLANIKL